MSISLSDVQNKTQKTRDFEDLRKLPFALREYYSQQKHRFDELYDRRTDTYLKRFRMIKYKLYDRQYGNPNADIANIYWNIFNEKSVQDLIDELLFDRKWFYHPVRKFDKWHTVSEYYYQQPDYYWLLLVFNRISDPFQALQDFNIIRVPFMEFLERLPYKTTFDFSGGKL